MIERIICPANALPKKGSASVGVAPQYASALGESANCRTLVSLTLSLGGVPVPLALRLFLPEIWTADAVRLAKAGGDCQEFRVRAGIVGSKEIADGSPQGPQHSRCAARPASVGRDPKTAFDPGGLLDGLKKALAERALNAEMDHHLSGAEDAGNGRNGYGRKTVTTETGKFGLAVPRDRQASLIPSSSPSTSGAFRASTRRSCRCARAG